MSYQTFVIGRGTGCDLTISDSTVSQQHAELIVAASGAAMLTDRCSTHGTQAYVQGKWRPVAHTAVEPGMRFRFGKKFEIDADKLVAAALSGSAPADGGAPRTVLGRAVKRDPETGAIIPG